MRRTSHKTPPAVLLLAFLALILPGCTGGGDARADRPKNTGNPDTVREPALGDQRGVANLDFGDDWDLVSSPDLPPAAQAPAGPIWTIVLQTFSTGDHQAAARRMLSQLPSIDPLLANARAHPTAEASMVIYGSYQAPDDPAAQADLKLIKSISIGERPVFARAMLTRIDPRTAPGQFKPFELLSVRQRYPKVDPLYTLDIAIWGTNFESGELSLQQVQAEAEAYTRRLRTQGIDAYFHHDPDRGLSTVSVGLFDHRAINAESGLYHPTVDAFIRRFPARLVNGEPLRVYIIPQRPASGTEIQQPRLVLVPKR